MNQRRRDSRGKNKGEKKKCEKDGAPFRRNNLASLVQAGWCIGRKGRGRRPPRCSEINDVSLVSPVTRARCSLFPSHPSGFSPRSTRPAPLVSTPAVSGCTDRTARKVPVLCYLGERRDPEPVWRRCGLFRTSLGLQVIGTHMARRNYGRREYGGVVLQYLRCGQREGMGPRALREVLRGTVRLPASAQEAFPFQGS